MLFFKRIYLKIINTRFFLCRMKPLKIEHGKVIGRKGKRKIIVRFDDGKIDILKEYDGADLEIGAEGDFIYKKKFMVEFERDIYFEKELIPIEKMRR